ncbi:MAG: hypothetical protein KGL69_06535 [Alphaproteobacteria bacterium]|nr:hypothetical protein [Alphaproteobacteria bacterium]
MTPSPLLRYARMDADVPAPAQRFNGGGMKVPPFGDIAAWLAEIDRQAGLMRPSRRLYERFDRTARALTPGRIRRCGDGVSVAQLVDRLRAARHPGGHDLHGLDRVWSRAELGVLITEAVNRQRQLAMGRLETKPKGPRLDPRRLPDARLEHLIQHHRDLGLVEALRAERRRRDLAGGGDAA